MEPSTYRAMAETEERHWWYAGRRAIIRSVLNTLSLEPRTEILEIGAGTGGNLPLLSTYGNISAVELDEFAREWAIRKTRVPVVEGRLPDALPVPRGHYGLVCLFDVLEHIEEDVASLVTIRNLLKEGGRVLLTVPAHPWLWSTHDEVTHHVRRYTRRHLIETVEKAGFHPAKVTYFNTFLFPLAVGVRAFDRAFGRKQPSGLSLPHPALNALFTFIFSSERALVANTGLPIGVSLLAVLEAKR